MRMQSYSGSLGQRTYQVVCDVRLVREVVFYASAFIVNGGSDAHASGHCSGAVGAFEVPLGAAPRDIGGVKAVWLFEAKFSRNSAPVLSDEGHGLSPSILSALTGGLRIPKAASMESINVAMVGAIALYTIFSNSFLCRSPFYLGKNA